VKRFKLWWDQHGTSTAATVLEVTTTKSSKSSYWIFDNSESSDMTLDSNWFESVSTVSGYIVFGDKTQVKYTEVDSDSLCYCLSQRDISVVLLHHHLFVGGLRKSLYSWNSIKLLGKFALNDNGNLLVVRKLDRSVPLNLFQSAKNFVLDLILSESTSHADNTDYDFWNPTLGPLFKANVNWKCDQAANLVLACAPTFTSNPCPLSKSNHKVRKPVELKSTAVF
jgi:hypothetical protein